MLAANDDDEDEEVDDDDDDDEEGGFTANTGGSWLKHTIKASARETKAWLRDDQLCK